MKWYNKLGKFLGVIFSIIYSIILIIMIILLFASSFLKGNLYGNILKSIDISEIKLSDISPELASMMGEDLTLEETFISVLEEAGIDSNVATKLVETEEVKEIAGDYIGEIINYTIYKEEFPEIKEKDVEKVIDNIDIEEITGESINKEEIMKFVEEFNSSTKDSILEEIDYEY